MPVIAPPSVTALPTPPSTASPSTFDARADAFLTALPTFQTENNAVAANVFANATDAATSATTATTQAETATEQAGAAAASAVAAATSAGAPTWANTGATYAIGDLRRSPANARIYRRLTASNAGTTDPSADPTNWAAYNIAPVWVVKAANYSPVVGDAVLANTTSGTWTLTLPALPAANDTIPVADYAGTFGTNKLIVARNGNRINALLEDMDVTKPWASFDLVYIDATVGWRTL